MWTVKSAIETTLHNDFQFNKNNVTSFCILLIVASVNKCELLKWHQMDKLKAHSILFDSIIIFTEFPKREIHISKRLQLILIWFICFFFYIFFNLMIFMFCRTYLAYKHSEKLNRNNNGYTWIIEHWNQLNHFNWRSEPLLYL